MALINSNGELITFCCDELISEVENDIIEFGSDTIVDVWCKDLDGVTVITNYDYEIPELLIEDYALEPGEYIKKMSLADLLVLLEKQNSVM